ncbi:unnamed protein product [Rhizophagus irregularis]|nr:unnamed protein product [Rhizophagus irregularis]CAB5387054.1 unnamed protein product [Rhizophagus irregularis]
MVDELFKFKEVKYTESDVNCLDLLTNQLKKDIKVDKKLIPTYHPYNSNRIPTREAVEEFDTNDRKVVTHLAKDDKMKGVSTEDIGGRGRNQGIVLLF